MQCQAGCDNSRFCLWQQMRLGGKTIAGDVYNASTGATIMEEWKDDCWRRVATADVEDGGQFRKCEIFAHRTGGGHCIFFGDKDYEGMGKDQTHGTYTYINKILRDSDGDLIRIRNIVEDGNGEVPELASESDEEYVPDTDNRQQQRRGSGMRGAGRGTGRASIVG